MIPDEATRLAALKRGEVDIVYSIRGELAEELQRTPGLTLKPAVIQGTFWLYFADQWDPKSPWHDRRVRQAASLAIDRPSINQALTLGHSRLTGSIIPTSFEYFWQPPAPGTTIRARAKKLLAEAGYPNGFDAGEYFCDASYANLGRGGRQRPPGGRHPRQAAAARARGLLQRLRGEEVQEPHPGLERRLRQRGHAPGGLRRHRRRLRLRQVPRHRRPLPGAGRRPRPQAARGHPAQDPAARPRQDDVRADLAAGLPQRRRAAGARNRGSA